MYESDITKFVRDLMDKNPELKELQKTNRATWWDKKQNLDELKRLDESAAPKQAYAYFPLPKGKQTQCSNSGAGALSGVERG